MPKDLTDWGIPKLLLLDFGGAKTGLTPISDAGLAAPATPLGKLESTMLLFKYPPVYSDCDEFSTGRTVTIWIVAGLY